MKNDKTNEGRQGGRGSQDCPEWRSRRERNEWRYAGRQMKGEKAAAAASGDHARRQNEGRQGGRGSQEQPRIEIMQGDK